MQARKKMTQSDIQEYYIMQTHDIKKYQSECCIRKGSSRGTEESAENETTDECEEQRYQDMNWSKKHCKRIAYALDMAQGFDLYIPHLNYYGVAKHYSRTKETYRW